MTLKEKCEELGISLAEGKEKYGLTHWKQQVVETESKEAESVNESVVVETESKQEPIETKLGKCPCSLDDLALSIKIHGNGSPVWAWRGLLDGD